MDGADIYITCHSVPSANVTQIFLSSSIQEHAGLFLNGSYSSLPADLVGSKQIRDFGIDCQGGTVDIDVDVFRQSQNYMNYLDIYNCDLTAFSFLTNFTALQYLKVHAGSLSTITTMPFLSSLLEINLINCEDFRAWYPTSQTPKLVQIYMENISVDGSFLEKIADYENLQGLALINAGLTQMPLQIKSFGRLDLLTLDSNDIRVIPAGSVVANKIDFLSFFNSSVTTIEQAALQGLNKFATFSNKKLINCRNLIIFCHMLYSRFQRRLHRLQ